MFPLNGPAIESVQADVNDDVSTTLAVTGAWGVVNAISLYIERGKDTFRSVHVEAAERVAQLARRAGVERLAHLSGIGSSPESNSIYIRSRGEGELAVRSAFPAAMLIRPAIMFGRGDAFVTPVAKMLRYWPIFPMFGHGQTRLQPAYVEDVAEGIALALNAAAARPIYEFAGPRAYSYETLLRVIAASIGKKPLLFPLPFPLWRTLGYFAERLPRPPITRNQVELMGLDNIAAPDVPGFATLFISPRAIEDVLPQIVPTPSL